MDPGPRVTRLEAEEVLRIEAVLAATETNETKSALPLVFVLWKSNNIILKMEDIPKSSYIIFVGQSVEV